MFQQNTDYPCGLHVFEAAIEISSCVTKFISKKALKIKLNRIKRKTATLFLYHVSCVLFRILSPKLQQSKRGSLAECIEKEKDCNPSQPTFSSFF